MSLVRLSIYESLKKDQKYSDELEKVIFRTVEQLKDRETSAFLPGMLLGKVQSGKTRAFIGVIGAAFDQGFDVAVILTKGTKPLALQTLSRLRRDFGEARDREWVEVYDVMPLPEPFNRWEAKRKLIFVCKKETQNMENLRRVLLGKDHLLRGRRVLFVDDEADFASIGFRRSDGEITVATIAAKIDDLRRELSVRGAAPAFLQVTATPYALYLQPESIQVEGRQIERIRPSFTELVPVHDAYIGGDFFFDGGHRHRKVADHCFHPISDAEELDVLKREDGRRVKAETVLTVKSIPTVRAAVMQFAVGAAVRRVQALQLGKKPARYSFIVHTETGKPAHGWQAKLFGWVVAAFQSQFNGEVVQGLMTSAIDNLRKSVSASGLQMPSDEMIRNEVSDLLDATKIVVVNSEKDVEKLLDEEGQLRLSNPLSLFVGGQILDRGITIGNLIGFFYGRNPRKFQQDTVLQHARIFGARQIDDLTVTRLYTTHRLYNAMERIHNIDTALRDAFERGQKEGVVFIQRDAQKEIKPCSPNKIMVSNTVTLRPGLNLLPVGFNTATPKKATRASIERLDSSIASVLGLEDLSRPCSPEPVTVPLSTAIDWLRIIEGTLIMDEGEEFDWEAMRAALEYLALKSGHVPPAVPVMVMLERNVLRVRNSGRYGNSPYTKQQTDIIAKSGLDRSPVLMLFRQIGSEEQGWNGCPFWWPVLQCPAKMAPVIYSTNITEDVGEDDA